MNVRISSLVIVGLVVLSCVAAVRAEEVPKLAAEHPEGSALSTAPEKIRLLDQIPDYAAALRSQWSDRDLPPGIEELITNVEHYGRLRELSAPDPLTLDDCIALALANNTDLQISRLGPLGARAQVRRAQSIFDPSLFADVTTDRSEVPAAGPLQSGKFDIAALQTPGAVIPAGPKTRLETVDLTGDLGLHKLLVSGGQLSVALHTNRFISGSPFLSDFVPQYQTNLTLSVNQPLLRDFGRYFTILQIRIARTTEKSAAKQYEATLASAIKGVEQAYWTLVQTNQTVAVQEQGLALAKELQRQNEGKFKVGAAPRTAVLEAQTEVARRETNLIQATNARTIARDALRALINAKSPETESLRIVEPADVPKARPYAVDLDRSLATALERRPELAAAKLNVQGVGMQLKIAENQLLPRLNAVGSLGSAGLSGNGRTIGILGPEQQNSFTGPYEKSYNGLIDGRYYSYSAGLTFEMPLNNAQARADYAQVRVGVEQARLGLQQMQENVTLEVKRAVTNLTSDLKSIDATRIARELAEENLRNQKARYDVGLATTKDMLDFQDRLTQARAAEVQALTTYNTDLAELHRVEGTLLDFHHVRLTTADDEPTPWWVRF